MSTIIPEQEIRNVSIPRPHIALLGAGASLAAFPEGDRNGRTLPLMQNLVEVVGLQSYLEDWGIDYKGRNFEDVYSELHGLSQAQEALQMIEQHVGEYFGSLELPETPTLYDHLVLSLREKDVIATFNWDPFLLKAALRNSKVAKPPHLLFLHGNAAVGVCLRDKKKGAIGTICDKCGQRLTRSKLLFPVQQKNYASDPYISSEWETLRGVLEYAYVFTIFGYSAPNSDIEAVELMRTGWGKVEERNLEEIEIINIEDEDKLIRAWRDFIHTHHYRTTTSFYESWTARHPRRTCDAMWSQLMDVQFLDDNWLPRHADFDELWEWYSPLIEAEG